MASIIVFSCDRFVRDGDGVYCSPIVASSIRLITDNFEQVSVVAPLVAGKYDELKHVRAPASWTLLPVCHAATKLRRFRQAAQVLCLAMSRHRNFDVVYTRLFSLDAMPAAIWFRIIRRKQWCITLHGDVEESIAISWSGRNRMLVHTVTGFFARLCRWLCMTAEAVFSSGPVLAEKYFGERTDWTTFMDAGVRAIDIYSERTDTCQTEPTKLVHVGDISPRKGVHHLFRAVGILKRRGVSVSLTMIGAGDREWADSIAASEDIESCIYYCGYLKYGKPLFERIRDGDILVAPSIGSEGWNRAILEANAQGLPIIASNINSLGVGVSQYGAGMVVEKGNPDAIATAVSYVIDHPQERQAMIQGSLQRAQDNLFEVEFPRIRQELCRAFPQIQDWIALDSLDLAAAGR